MIVIHMANFSFRIVSVNQGYHVYKDDVNSDMVFTWLLANFTRTVQLDDAFQVLLSDLETVAKLERVLITLFQTNI